MPAPTRFATWRSVLAAGTIVSCTPDVVLAHVGGPQAGEAWWQAWHFDPLVTANLLLILSVYGWGTIRLWRRAGVGRGVSRWRVGAFLGGVMALLLALMSPLDTLSEELSWVHMVQHMVLMVVAAPLMVLGIPGLVATWAMPRVWRRGVAAGGRVWPWRSARWRDAQSLAWNPLLIWSLHAVVLWGWHLPVLYELALADPLVHDIEHLTFFIVACLFWRVAIDPRTQKSLNPGLGVLYLFTTSLHGMVLGVFMTLSPSVWYPAYSGRTERWGFDPLEDQQLAGAIMWMPACTTYAVVAAGLFANWLRALDSPPSDDLTALPGNAKNKRTCSYEFGSSRT